MRLLIDTNRVSDSLRGDASLLALIENSEECWLPFITLAELKAGFLDGKRRPDNERVLQEFIQASGTQILFPTRATADHYARLYVQLKRAGKPIPDNDLWIAALALQHDLVLMTRDRHFDAIPQLMRG